MVVTGGYPTTKLGGYYGIFPGIQLEYSTLICLDKSFTWMESVQAKLGDIYPLVNIQKAIENGHRNSGFTHEKWLFSIVMLDYQRVPITFTMGIR